MVRLREITVFRKTMELQWVIVPVIYFFFLVFNFFHIKTKVCIDSMRCHLRELRKR